MSARNAPRRSRLRDLAGWRLRLVNESGAQRTAPAETAPPSPPAGMPSATYTMAALAEAVARVSAHLHGMPDPGPSGDLRSDDVVVTLAAMLAVILGEFPAGRGAAVLKAFGARAAAGQSPPEE